MEDQEEYIFLGTFSAHHGIKGWLKIYSHTEPKDQILSYDKYFLFKKDQSGAKKQVWKEIEIDQGRLQGKGVVAYIKGYDSREESEVFIGCDIAVKREALAELNDGDYYWIDLVGLKVINQQNITLGNITEIMPTVANDVLIVKNKDDKKSEDGNTLDVTDIEISDTGVKEEYLIPYIIDHYVIKVDLDERIMIVDWDVDF